MRHSPTAFPAAGWRRGCWPLLVAGLVCAGASVSAANGFAGQNAAGFKNAEMDRLIDALEIELNRDKRKALWVEAQRLYASELPSLPLFFRSDSFILPKWLSGVRPTGNQYPTTLSITDWKAQP